MPEFRPGKLDQRITIKRETLTADGMGGDTVALNDVATLWAGVMPLGGRENEEWSQLNASHNYSFVIRYRSDIQADDRIVWDGESYNIRSIDKAGGRKMYLIIEAERGVAL